MCTGIRFVDDKGNMFFGRNLDWSFSYGEKIVFTPRNYVYEPAFNAIDEHRAVIGVGIVEENTPLYFDCANEHGLAVAGLNFPGYAQYAQDSVNMTTNIAAYEFPLWVARSFDTVDQVEEALHNVTIVARPINDKYPVAMLHWIIADKTRSIVVEYMADGMHVYHDAVDCLTNQPTFAYHVENIRNYMNCTDAWPQTVTWNSQELTAWGSGVSMHGIPGDYSSPSRFIRAAYNNAHYPVQQGENANVTRLFKTLLGSSMILGGAQMQDGQFEKTVFTSGYSAATNTYYKNTYENSTIAAYPMSAFNQTSSDLQLA